MARRTRRTRRTHYRSYKIQKYSNETYTFTGTGNITAAGTPVPMISAAATQGMRKVKNFTLTIACTAAIQTPIFFVLVYVPDGTLPSLVNKGTPANPVSIYEPNQNVILSGILSFNQDTSLTKFTRLARNLNSGDSIQLILAPVDNSAALTLDIAATLNYAISY